MERSDVNKSPMEDFAYAMGTVIREVDLHANVPFFYIDYQLNIQTKGC